MSARGWLLFAAMSVIWGVPYLMIKVAVAEVSVPLLIFTRSAVGAALLLPLALSAETRALLLRHWKAVAGFAFFEMIAAWLMLSDAERHLASSLTGLLAFVLFFALIREVGPTRALIFAYVNPAVALLAGVLILREPLTWWNIAGLALILAGSLLATQAGRRPCREAG